MSEQIDDNSDVLAGIRVLDFGRFIAGPYCAALLADLGADVIRIERVGGGEDRWMVPIGAEAGGAVYLAMNRNKRTLALDPASASGREIVRKLVATADVVVANLPPDVLVSLELDLESLRKIKSDVILTTVTAFGAGGPLSHKLGVDGVAQLMCGSTYLSGTPEQPVRASVYWVDFGTALLAAFGTLAALLERRKSGRGQKVEGALLRTAIAFNNVALIEEQLTGINRSATLNRSPFAAPADVFRTKDGWLTVHVMGNPMFKRWAKLMGEDHWLTDPRFRDDQSRGEHGEIISRRMSEWAAGRATEEALAELDKAKLPAGPLYSPRQAIRDVHVRAAGLLRDVDHPNMEGKVPLAPTPIELSETPGRLRHDAPVLGAHTDEILRDLGYDETAVEDLRRRGVIG